MNKSIHEAASLGELQTVKSYLAQGGDPNLRDRRGYTLLHAAMFSRNKALVALLLEREARVNVKSNPNRGGIGGAQTPLHLTAFGGWELAELLIARGAEINPKNESGETPLHMAARFGKLNVAKLLIANAAEVNCKNNCGKTPLLNASRGSNRDLVELLIANGAFVSDEMLTSALREGREEIAKLLIAKGANEELLLPYAARRGKIEIVREFIDRGKSVNINYEEDLTLLHLAAQNERKEMVEFLIDKGANVNPRTESGWTPRPSAVEGNNKRGHRLVVELLLSKGAEVNAKTNRPLQKMKCLSVLRFQLYTYSYSLRSN